jgi:hypothetical protein
MLDLDHPMSRHVFAASRAEDAILDAAKRMTVAARQDRVRLRDGCAPTFAELRRLARDYFADRPAIPPAIDALEQAVAQLAALPGVPAQGPPAGYQCPACGAAAYRLAYDGSPDPDNPTHVYCGPCLDIIGPARAALSSWEGGFGTDCI